MITTELRGGVSADFDAYLKGIAERTGDQAPPEMRRDKHALTDRRHNHQRVDADAQAD